MLSIGRRTAALSAQITHKAEKVKRTDELQTTIMENTAYWQISCRLVIANKVRRYPLAQALWNRRASITVSWTHDLIWRDSTYQH
jgi:hypothetical protein